MPLQITQSSPFVAAVSVAELKDHLRIDGDHDNTKLATLAQAAQEAIEGYSGRAVSQSTYQQNWDYYPPACVLRPIRAPIVSVTSLEVVDSSGTPQPVSAGDILIDTVSEPGRVYPHPDATWPTPADGYLGGIQLKFVAGATTTPEPIKLAIMELVHDLYEHRGETAEIALLNNPAVLSIVGNFMVHDFPKDGSEY